MDVEEFVKRVSEINQKREEKKKELKEEIEKTKQFITDTGAELQAELEEDVRRERDAEGRETKYDCWFSDNRIQLLKDFVEEFHEQEFDDYCKREYVDSDY
jgi:hypothetical protein